MPMYEFKDDDHGTLEEVFFPMDKVPSIGQVIKAEDGRMIRRVFSGGIRGEAITHQHGKYPYLSHSHTPWMPGCETAKDPRSGKLKPIIQSRQHERELCDRHGLVKE